LASLLLPCYRGMPWGRPSWESPARPRASESPPSAPALRREQRHDAPVRPAQAGGEPPASLRDLIHAAVMLNHDVKSVASFDAGFDQVKE
jgi:predicted nucleic acid-binding protein